VCCIPEYLEQVRTKRRSLDRSELATSPTKEIVDEPKGNVVVFELSFALMCFGDLFLIEYFDCED